MILRKVNLDWVMGFIEGEGAFCSWINVVDGKPYKRCALIIGQKERNILEKINDFFGSWGTISFHKQGKIYHLKFERTAKLRKLARGIRNHFRTTTKKGQFERWLLDLNGIEIMNPWWSKQEDKKLLENLDKSNEEIREMLPRRTVFAISQRRYLFRKSSNS